MTNLDVLKHCAESYRLKFQIDENKRFMYVGDIIWDCSDRDYERCAEDLISSALSRFSEQAKAERK